MVARALGAHQDQVTFMSRRHGFAKRIEGIAEQKRVYGLHNATICGQN